LIFNRWALTYTLNERITLYAMCMLARRSEQCLPSIIAATGFPRRQQSQTGRQRVLAKTKLAIPLQKGEKVALLSRGHIMNRRVLIALAISTVFLSLNGVAQLLPQHVVGYHTVQTCESGVFLIANPLQNGSNRLSEILTLPDWANGTTIYKFDALAQTFSDSITWIAGIGWLSTSDPDPTLSLGEGVLILTLSNDQPASVSLTFVGEIPGQQPCRSLEGANNQELWSPPFGKGLETLSPREGDTVYVYDCALAPEYNAFTYIDSIGWLNNGEINPQGPEIRPGVAAFLQLQGYERSSCATCSGCGSESAQSIVPDVPLSNPRKSGSKFAFSFSSQSNQFYQVQSSAMDPPEWSNLGPLIRATDTTTDVVDRDATSPSKFYRVVEAKPVEVRLANSFVAYRSSFVFSFNTQTNATYQVQYMTLGSTQQWANLGPPITPVKTNVWVQDPDARATARFYRVMQLP
jgi:hypothetical protein